MTTLSEQLKLAGYWLHLGNINSAKALLLEILQVYPHDLKATELLAHIFTHQNNKTTAIELLEKAASNPDCPPSVLLNLGDLYLESGQPQKAIGFYKATSNTGGEFFEALHNLGLAYTQLFQFEEATQAFQKAISFNPNSFEAQINLGSCLKNLGQYEQSLNHLILAEKIAPNDARVFLNKGVTYEAMDQQENAINCYEKAIRLEPKYLEAYCNKANSLLAIGQHEKANITFQKALSLNSSDADTLYNLSYLQLAEGNFKEGWKNYEYRWLRQNAPKKPFNAIPPLTSLENLKNKNILIWAEQGLGDTIQFARYISPLKKLGASITFAVQPHLAELMCTLDGINKIITTSDLAPPDSQFQAPLMSLPLLFEKANIPEPTGSPYLKSNSLKVDFWRSRLQNERKLKVGLVWNGGFRPNQPGCWAVNARRNIPLSIIARLQNIRGIEFFSLQKGEPSESELTSHKSEIWPNNNLSIYTSELLNFSDTAGLIENLDLVISVDTSTAHLAGALGKPVWILNRFDSCWRWMIQQELTHWYPTARIFNQPQPGNWESVITKVENELRTLV